MRVATEQWGGRGSEVKARGHHRAWTQVLGACHLPHVPTCPDACLAEQLGQAAHAIEGVEVVHILVQPIHPILVLWAGETTALDDASGPGPKQAQLCAVSACLGSRSQGAGKRGCQRAGGDGQVLTVPQSQL